MDTDMTAQGVTDTRATAGTREATAKRGLVGANETYHERKRGLRTTTKRRKRPGLVIKQPYYGRK